MITPKQQRQTRQIVSPADVCLKRADTWLNFDLEKESFEVSGNHRQLHVVFEHRAWVCCFCGESTEYFVLNGYVVRGCGSHDRYENGKHSQHCDKLACIEAADIFHL